MKEKLPLNPKTEIFSWGPIPGKLFYASDFIPSMFTNLMDRFGECWPPSLFLFHGGRMAWVNEYPIFRKRARKVFIKYIESSAGREKLRRTWRRSVKKLFALCDTIERADLKKFSESEFMLLWRNFYNLMSEFWTPSVIPEFANYGSEEYLKENLLAAGVPVSEILAVMEILTAPEAFSFYAQEEIELSETEDADAHANKYFWLKNSYNQAHVLPVSFFAERKKALPKNVRGREEKRILEVRRLKQEVIKKYALSREVVNIAEAIVFGIEWQDERKGYIFKTIHDKALLLAEVSRRHGRSFSDLLTVSVFDVTDIVEGKMKFAEVSAAKEYFGMRVRNRSVMKLSEAEALRYWKLYVEGEAKKDIQEFHGVVASVGSGGQVCGKVRIMLDPHDLAAFKEGEILVTAMTSPEYVFAMKKAAAIVTDAGGLTSHAAVTSRELGKPCIVGTKVATRVLQNGDEVEVDTGRGVVSLLKKFDGGKIDLNRI